MARIRFHNGLLSTALLVVWLGLGSAQQPAPSLAEPSIAFLHISDTHVSGLSGVHPKLQQWRGGNSTAGAALTRFLETTLKEQAPDFAVVTGDLVDAYCFDGAAGKPVFGQIELFESIVKKTPAPLYLAPGNHDIECYRYVEGRDVPIGDQSVRAEARRAWTEHEASFRKGTYYTFRKQVGRTGYSFFVLDNGETGEFRDPEYRDAQARWLKKEMAAHPGDFGILMMHIPLSDGNVFTNSIRSAIAAHGRTVLSLAGHNHRDEIDEVPFGARSLAQVRTASLAAGENNWRTIRLFEDRIEIMATGEPGTLLKTIPLPLEKPE